METPKEYYYTYYSYEEWGMGYFGSRGCKCLPEEDVKYFGSSKDKNFKPTKKIILKDDYATREEAYADEIILQQYYKVVENPHFANRAYQTSTKFYVPTEQAIENGRTSGLRNKENGTGFFKMTKEEILNNTRNNGLKAKENGTGIFAFTPEQRSENSRKIGLKNKENGTGIFSQTPKQRRELGSRNGIKTKEKGTGIFGMTSEQKRERSIKGGTKTSSQRWECLETGFISGPGPLTIYQRNRGIDTSKRRRIS